MFENRQLAVFEGKCCRFRNSSECLKTHCGANSWPIWTQKVSKEAQICRLQTSIRVFPKIFCCTWAVGCRKFVQYIRMLCSGRFILVESVPSFLRRNKIKPVSHEKHHQLSTIESKVFSKHFKQPRQNTSASDLCKQPRPAALAANSLSQKPQQIHYGQNSFLHSQKSTIL